MKLSAGCDLLTYPLSASLCIAKSSVDIAIRPPDAPVTPASCFIGERAAASFAMEWAPSRRVDAASKGQLGD
jgi:hypothetical protein